MMRSEVSSLIKIDSALVDQLWRSIYVPSHEREVGLLIAAALLLITRSSIRSQRRPCNLQANLESELDIQLTVESKSQKRPLKSGQ